MKKIEEKINSEERRHRFWTKLRILEETEDGSRKMVNFWEGHQIQINPSLNPLVEMNRIRLDFMDAAENIKPLPCLDIIFTVPVQAWASRGVILVESK